MYAHCVVLRLRTEKKKNKLSLGMFSKLHMLETFKTQEYKATGLQKGIEKCLLTGSLSISIYKVTHTSAILALALQV